MLDRSTCEHCLLNEGMVLDLSPINCGQVMCPHTITATGYANMDKPPPKWCPYALEHIMKENKDAETKATT